MEDYHPNNILRKQRNWNTLHFYQKTQVLYQLTFDFTARYLKRGDRTIDQMVQAARSGKQNIVEGMADGVTSSEMEIKLLNVSRVIPDMSRCASFAGTTTNWRIISATSQFGQTRSWLTWPCLSAISQTR